MPKGWQLNMAKNSEALILNKQSLNKSAIFVKEENSSIILRRCRFFVFIRKIDKMPARLKLKKSIKLNYN